MRVSGHSLRWEHPRVWLAALLMTSVFFFSVMTGHAQSTPPAPTITSISPSVVAAGQPDFFLIVNGTP